MLIWRAEVPGVRRPDTCLKSFLRHLIREVGDAQVAEGLDDQEDDSEADRDAVPGTRGGKESVRGSAQPAEEAVSES